MGKKVCHLCLMKFDIRAAPNGADSWRCPQFGCGVRYWDVRKGVKVKVGVDPDVKQSSVFLATIN